MRRQISAEGREGFRAAEREDNELGVGPAGRFCSLGVTDSSGEENGCVWGVGIFRGLKTSSCMNYSVEPSVLLMLGLFCSPLCWSNLACCWLWT